MLKIPTILCLLLIALPTFAQRKLTYDQQSEYSYIYKLTPEQSIQYLNESTMYFHRHGYR